MDQVKNALGTIETNFALTQFINLNDLADYFRFAGSLTTPPCTEGIIWNVVMNTIPISKTQVKCFKML